MPPPSRSQQPALGTARCPRTRQSVHIRAKDRDAKHRALCRWGQRTVLEKPVGPHSLLPPHEDPHSGLGERCPRECWGFWWGSLSDLVIRRIGRRLLLAYTPPCPGRWPTGEATAAPWTPEDPGCPEPRKHGTRQSRVPLNPRNLVRRGPSLPRWRSQGALAGASDQNCIQLPDVTCAQWLCI